MIRRLLIAFLPFAPTTLAMGAAAQGQEPSHPPELVALATELRQWQRDQPAGAPDFAEQVEKRKRELPEFRQRLHRLNPRNWPVHAQVDYLMLQAELDALDFRLNVIRETSKNPDFYLSQAVSRVTRHIGGRFQRAPGVTVPYDADRAAAIVQALTEIEAIVSQAPRALSGRFPSWPMWRSRERTAFARTAPSSPGWSANTCPSPTPRKSAPLRSGRPRPSFSIASGFGRTALVVL